ncbi:MAG: tetratricopeptide repeat protein [Gallionellaceae bacterium]|nr:tetratricopeptide repeat protein [Gallionellaceae bacterium]
MKLSPRSSRKVALLLACVALLSAALLRDRIAFELGYAYAHGDFHGWTLTRDDTQAVAWLTRAAELGHARSQYLLGLSYSRGRGVRQDDAEAERWFDLAASQSYAPACFHLAWMLHKGEGVAHDEARAQRLMAQAAGLGMSAASLALGRFHERGEGVEKDAVAALHWYTQAVESSHLHPELFDNAHFAEQAVATRERMRVVNP